MLQRAVLLFCRHNEGIKEDNVIKIGSDFRISLLCIYTIMGYWLHSTRFELACRIRHARVLEYYIVTN